MAKIVWAVTTMSFMNTAGDLIETGVAEELTGAVSAALLSSFGNTLLSWFGTRPVDASRPWNRDLNETGF